MILRFVCNLNIYIFFCVRTRGGFVALSPISPQELFVQPITPEQEEEEYTPQYRPQHSPSTQVTHTHTQSYKRSLNNEKNVKVSHGSEILSKQEVIWRNPVPMCSTGKLGEQTDEALILHHRRSVCERSLAGRVLAGESESWPTGATTPAQLQRSEVTCFRNTKQLWGVLKVFNTDWEVKRGGA